MGKIKDLKNQKFGKLTVLEFLEINSNHKAVWKCICECGNEKNIISASLLTGHTTSCGCLEYENRLKNIIPGGNLKHNKSRTRIYKIWSDMKIRCNDKNNKLYGYRGISYDSKWEQFELFYDEMKDSYNDNLTLERIDVNGNYTKENCTWISNKEQQKNKRNTIYVTYNDCEYRLLDLYNKLQPNIKYNTVKNRIVYGNWSVEDAFNIPVDTKRRHRNG